MILPLLRICVALGELKILNAQKNSGGVVFPTIDPNFKTYK